MNLASRPAGRVWAVASAAVFVAALSACAPQSDDNGSATDTTPTQSGGTSGASSGGSGDACAVDQLHLISPGTLTVATDSPAYDPWFSHNDPSNGKGFESAVTYAVAKQLGFTPQQVTWVDEPFNKSFAPGAKDFDFDINQISITPDRAKVVDFSDGYNQADQAVVVMKDSSYADATSLADLKNARIGAQIGTTSLLAAQDVIKPAQQVAVFDDTNAAKQSLLNGQLDAIVADLPTAFYITAAQIPGSTILGQFPANSGAPEEFGLLLQKGNPLVTCLNKAITALKDDGTLDKIQHRWLSQDVDVPELS
jgi:polar amino acid transport system substrate-binding protein